jgi:XapX domain-containing protein
VAIRRGSTPQVALARLTTTGETKVRQTRRLPANAPPRRAPAADDVCSSFQPILTELLRQLGRSAIPCRLADLGRESRNIHRPGHPFRSPLPFVAAGQAYALKSFVVSSRNSEVNHMEIVGLLLGLIIGAGCRILNIPSPAPPTLIGALLVVAMTVGFIGADRVLAPRDQVLEGSVTGTDTK